MNKPKLTKAQRKDYDSLESEEKVIYDSIRTTFSATTHDYAYNKAMEGGCTFQFICK